MTPSPPSATTAAAETETISTEKDGSMVLPEGFQPTDDEVIIGRGKRVAYHLGNQRLHDLVRTELKEYSEAETKTEKSYVLSKVLYQVRRWKGDGKKIGFVKWDPKRSRWISPKDSVARVTIAQAFRDGLSSRYSSSKSNKQRRRQIEKGYISEEDSGSLKSASDNVSATESGEHTPRSTTAVAHHDAHAVAPVMKTLHCIQGQRPLPVGLSSMDPQALRQCMTYTATQDLGPCFPMLHMAKTRRMQMQMQMHMQMQMQPRSPPFQTCPQSTPTLPVRACCSCGLSQTVAARREMTQDVSCNPSGNEQEAMFTYQQHRPTKDLYNPLTLMEDSSPDLEGPTSPTTVTHETTTTYSCTTQSNPPISAVAFEIETHDGTTEPGLPTHFWPLQGDDQDAPLPL